MKATPGGGSATSGRLEKVSSLPLFHIARHETTVAMYVDFLNETGADGLGWSKGMANPERVGILRVGDAPPFRYEMAKGRERHPVALVSSYNAVAFLEWCGLRLPSEAEWEKAYRGGRFLDGDDARQRPNPLPEREYPWGSEPPQGEVARCNFDGGADGYPDTAPVGSFPGFASPYGVLDMAGNVAEWTADTWQHDDRIKGYAGLVLVIEDDMLTAGLIRTQLMEGGYRVALVASGHAGLGAAKRLLPQVITQISASRTSTAGRSCTG